MSSLLQLAWFFYRRSVFSHLPSKLKHTRNNQNTPEKKLRFVGFVFCLLVYNLHIKS